MGAGVSGACKGVSGARKGVSGVGAGVSEARVRAFLARVTTSSAAPHDAPVQTFPAVSLRVEGMLARAKYTIRLETRASRQELPPCMQKYKSVAYVTR